MTNQFKDDFFDFLDLESKALENVVCYELFMVARPSLYYVNVGIKK